MKELKMIGLEETSENTVNWEPGSGGYTEIFYDTNTGEVWTVDQVSLGHNNWTVYHDPAIIKICETEVHLSPEELAEMIRESIR